MTGRRRAMPLVVGVIAALAGVAVTALLVNIFTRRQEARNPFYRVVALTDETVDPAVWGENFPLQYDGYRRTVDQVRTRYGGSEAVPRTPSHADPRSVVAQSRLEEDPRLKIMWAGYAFAVDFREERGHAYMLADQEATERLSKPQSGSCLHCHASVMPLYRELGKGDVLAGLEATSKMSYADTNAKLREMGHAQSVSCVDCHVPNTLELRVTRPGFLVGIRALAESDAPVPHLPSIEEWRAGSRERPYDPNVDARRSEMRSFVCGQCHVEYYCSTKLPLTFPWGKGLRAEDIEATWNATKFPDGTAFLDYKHAETGAPVLKAQHPEFELWSQGIHARSGVSCADCHMPYMREGASKVSDHWVRSPLLNVNRACQTCHRASEAELLARVDLIQSRNQALLQRSAAALMDLLDAVVAARAAGASDAQLARALDLQRQAQWRIDFIAAENSMGFHAPQEAARVLGEAVDLARQGQIAALERGREKAR